MPTDRWIRQHYPFGGYGAAEPSTANQLVWYALAFAMGWIANTYYEKQTG